MTKQEYETLKAEAMRDLDAIERVYRMSQGSGAGRCLFGSDESEAPASGANGAAVGRGRLMKEVRKVIDSFSDKFTIHTIVEALKNAHVVAKKPSIRPILKRLEKADAIEVVKQGIGRAATIYEKA